LGEFGDKRIRSSTLFIRQSDHGFILVSNNLEQLTNVALHLHSSSSKTLSNIRDWSEVSQKEFWGYRKYRHGTASARDTTFTGTNGVTPNAEAMILFVDQKRQNVVVRLFTSQAVDATAANLNKMYRIRPLKPVGAGVWESISPLPDMEPFSESSNLILWFFGLGVAV
jgi:hypothetical protein